MTIIIVNHESEHEEKRLLTSSHMMRIIITFSPDSTPKRIIFWENMAVIFPLKALRNLVTEFKVTRLYQLIFKVYLGNQKSLDVRYSCTRNIQKLFTICKIFQIC